jgi:signal transduction histidine kinase
MPRLLSIVGHAPSLGTPQTRSVRLVAWGRVVLAAVALVAVWIDPELPRQHVALTHAALVAYLAYAVVLAVVVGRSPAPPPWLPLATHAIDLLGAPVLMILTEGPNSPFFLYFLFPLLAATLRWQLRGTVWTAGVSLALFLGMGALAWWALPAGSLEADRFLVRAAFLAVMAVLLGALGAHEQALRAQLLHLARGPRSSALYAEELARDALRHATVLAAPRVVMTWEDDEEPWLNLAWSENGTASVGREAPSTWEPLVAEPLASAGFLCLDAAAPSPVAERETERGFARWHGAPLHPGFRERFAVRSVVSVPLRGAGVAGRLFWLDCRDPTADDLLVAHIVAGQVAPELDQILLQRKLREAAVDHERVLLARDLHDGLLQSLTAVALQVQSARDAMAGEPEAARERLSVAQRTLADEQRALRLFIRQMRAGPHPEVPSAGPLCERVRDLAERVGRDWGLAVRVEHEGMRAPLGPGLEQQAYLMLQEALVNAARHAGASRVRVSVAAADGRLRLAVEDDGRGFPFHGSRDGEELAAAGEGPRSLRERVAGLGGRLVVHSSENGARVEIDVPLPLGAA